jgi:hypothetical protein
MAKISEYSSDFELPPEGKHPARLIKFIDLGSQPSKFGASRQAQLVFQLIGQTLENGDPMCAFKYVFNLSPRSKNFRDIVRSLTGAHDISTVEVSELIGLPCELSIEHTTNDSGDVFANCEVRPLKNAKSLDDAISPKVFFSLHPAEFDVKAISGLSERQQEKIKESSTYRELLATAKFVAKSAGKPASQIVNDGFPENLE